MGPVVGGLLIGAQLSTPALFLCAAVPGALAAEAVFLLHTVNRARQAEGGPQVAGPSRAGRDGPDELANL